MAYVINRPDKDALQRLLDRHGYDATGTVLRLAWLEGLSREEIVGLTWADISLDTKEIILKDRRIPFYGDMEDCIRERAYRYAKAAPYVVISEKYQDAMKPESVSRLARRALDEEGMKEIRLVDLRHDFVIQRLETENWATVARLSGLSVGMFQTVYSDYTQVRTKPQGVSDSDDEYHIWRILQEQRGTMIGLALALRWYMNVQLIEITWDDVDFEANILHLPDQDMEIAGAVRKQLELEREKRKEGDDPHVLLTERSRTPMDAPYLSKQIRTVLIRGGVEHIPFRYFQRATGKNLDKRKIIEMAKSKPGLVRDDVIKELKISSNMAHSRLRELVDEGELIRIDRMYYLPGKVVAPDKQEQAVISFLRDNKAGNHYELQSLLGMERKQCNRLLRKMIAEGKIERHGSMMSLPEEKNA